MSQSVLILFAIFVPIIWGVCILAKKEFKTRRTLITFASIGLAVTTILSLAILFIGDMQLYVFAVGENMHIFF